MAEAEPDLLGGEEIVSELGPCTVHTHAYPLASKRGSFRLGALLDQTPDPIGRVFPDFSLDAINGFQDAAFLDTETTGLGTGASVYAFMVGIGTFETLAKDGCGPPVGASPAGPTHFVVRQVFMRNPAEELALIHESLARLASKRLLVTFNGRSFDIPLLRARVRYNRPFLAPNEPGAPLLDRNAPHLDLLLPARRLWRRRLQSCRLAYLEEVILAHRRTTSDVPGHLIPQLYTDFVRSGDPRDMERVFYHNREDIVSMVSLATHLLLAFDEKRNQSANVPLEGQDWLSLGMTYERMQDASQAESAYNRALAAAGSPSDRAEIFSRLGRLQKREGRWQDAADTWQLWLTSIPGNEPEPYVELAKYCEWQIQDYEQAEMWTAWAVHNLRHEESEHAWKRTIDELEHRLKRIRRKKSR